MLARSCLDCLRIIYVIEHKDGRVYYEYMAKQAIDDRHCEVRIVVED